MIQSCLCFSQDYEGRWQGNLSYGSASLPFVLKLKLTQGQWMVEADSPKQGVHGIPGKVGFRADSIFVQLQGGIRISGVLFGDSTIKATFMQAGVKLPLLLARRTGTDMDLKPLIRPQTPQPPYGYDTIDVSFRNDYDKITLAGTMSYPRKSGRYPAVILLTGSGAQNRNEELFGHQVFKVLSDYLTNQGIVVLRYDDRGVGLSGGVFETSTIEDFSKDAMAALEFLKKQKQVDPQKLGIIGHSEGGLIAELLAGQGLSDLSFIVSLAGPAISIDRLMVEQLYAIGKSGGMSEANLEIAKRINSKNFAIIKSDLTTAEAYRALMENVGGVIENNGSTELQTELMTMLAPAYRYFVRIEPEQYLPKITVPVFAAFGSLDVQVPADVNLKSLFDLLPKNRKNVLKKYEGLNHLFQQAKTGQVAEYAQIEETISTLLLKDIAGWIKGL
ncbi:alpha/beta hydrolase family protein [Sphingobacterium faecale]|uniref:Alpha/beta hydrolase n=1 Tax=Sphingobacterium faecale TaxID=2803775 RepID=A0ABS1R7W7_9SPHI|nr:alpha/beta hydrolase [Sphingobacterium faecale]MBL1410610.1 alpha/beta hydrolase [Sphingobacterium faecale]